MPRPADRARVRWANATGSLVCAMSLGGCSVDVDLSGKHCPCGPGYTCDPVQNLCVTGPSCEPKIRVEDFQAAWSTSNAIYWTWDPQGLEEDFLRYEMVLAQTAEDLASRTGTVRVYSPDVNPELGGFTRPRTEGTNDVVRGTLTDEIQPATSYVGRLLAVDDDLCAFSTDIVGKGTTIELPDEVVIFRDDPPPGYPLPSSFGPVDDTTGGGRHLEFRPSEDPECAGEPDSTCGQPLRYQSMDLDLGAISRGQFEDAFLELRIASNASVHSYYSLVWLWFDDCADSGSFRFVPFTIRSTGDYQRLQIPLRAFPNDLDASPLTHAVLETDEAGTPLCGFGISGAWQLGSTIRIDDMRVRF